MKDVFVNLFTVLKEILMTVKKEMWEFIKQRLP